MKKMTLLCGCFLFLIVPVWAQSGEETTVVPDVRLSELHSEVRIEKILENQPQIIQYWNYFLDHSYMVEDIPDEKTYAYPNLKDLVKINRETNAAYEVSMEESALNVVLFDLTIEKDKRSIYRLGDTGKIIVFFSKNEFLTQYNSSLISTE